MADGTDGDRVGASYSDASPFVRLLGNESRVRIIDAFLRKHYEELSASDIAELADIHRSTVDRNIEQLIEVGVVDSVNGAGNTTRYVLNKESRITQALERTRSVLLEESQSIPSQSHRTQWTPKLSAESLNQVVNELYEEIKAPKEETTDTESEAPSASDIEGLDQSVSSRRVPAGD